MGLSVLMSLYVKEKASNLRECLESLVAQTRKADEWLIVKDGPLTTELEDVLAEYEAKYPGLIHFVVFEKNQGLGLALRAGVQACKNEMIARMDTDDICIPTRFERQLAVFDEDKDLAICGSHIKEFEGDIQNIISERKVPLKNEDIRRYQKKRSAFNHMSVMFKKSKVLEAGNYEHAPLMEDDMLWVRLFIANCKGANIDDYLVYARTGLNMIARRGGFTYFKKYRTARKKIKALGYISYGCYLHTNIIQFVSAILPGKLRIILYTKMLRNN